MQPIFGGIHDDYKIASAIVSNTPECYARPASSDAHQLFMVAAMSMTRFILFLLLTFVMSCVGAADNPEWNAVAAAYSQAKATGDLVTIETSLNLATTYVQKYPNDGRAMTYRGSLSALKARESTLIWHKFNSLKHGLSWMDEGVSAVLKDKNLAGGRIEIEVRMVRGVTSAQIPKMLGRGPAARLDFLAVIANPFFKELNKLDKASAYAWLAVLSHRQNDESTSDGWLSRARAVDVATANSIWDKNK